MKTIPLMKVYVSSPEKMFMFWGHDGELFAKSVIYKYFAKICKGYGGCEKTFLELKKALQGSIMYTYIYCTKMSTSALNGIKCCKYCINIFGLKIGLTERWNSMLAM